MRFLFASGTSVLEQGNGAAHSMAALLEALAARGHDVEALHATVFHAEAGGKLLLKLADRADRAKVFRLRHRGVEHYIVRTDRTERGLMTGDEEELVVQAFGTRLRERPPDVLLSWGGRLLERALRAHARREDIRVVLSLTDPTYRQKETFADVDLVVTDSESTAALYRGRLGIHPQSIGKLIDAKLYKAARRTPRYITLVNPRAEKGASVFAALALRAANDLPEAQFLVVESGGTWAAAAKHLGLDPADFRNVYVTPGCSDMRPVYGHTRVLLVPSLWHESGPRVVAEALLNGIPIMGSTSGGIPENLAGSGFAFELPEAVRTDWYSLPPPETVGPWLETLTRLMRDHAFYAAESQKALEASAYHDFDRNVSRFLEIVARV